MRHSHPKRAKVSGGSEYWTLREIYEKQGRDIESYMPPPEFQYLVEAYWDVKLGDLDHRIKRKDFSDTLLDRNERGIILQMDRAVFAQLSEERAKADKARADAKAKK